MRKASIAIALLLFSATSYAGELITKDIHKCSTQNWETVSRKLQSVDRFSTIDDHTVTVAAFYKANLLYSHPQGNNLVGFVIKPAPALDLGSDAASVYPKFIATCTFDEQNKYFECKKADNSKKFAVDHFKLSFQGKSKPVSKECPSGIELDIHYEIQVNDQDYKSIVKRVQDASNGLAGLFSNMDDQKAFFTEYWNAFLTAWEDNSWLQ